MMRLAQIHRRPHLLRWGLGFQVAALLCSLATCQIPEQYPKPLIHTTIDHPAKRILLVVVDGLRAFDLADWIVGHPNSSLAALSSRGVTYTNARTPMADPLVGLMALTTGGTPISTGILGEDAYDPSLSPADSGCNSKGAVLSFDPAQAPLDPAHNCSLVTPHQLLRVNTIFEVVHQKIGPTAWAGSSYGATDLLRGPSGNGVDDACGAVQASDGARLKAVLNWIDSKDCSGDRIAAVPSLFGLSLTTGDRLPQLDSQLGTLIASLKSHDLCDSTWIVVAAPWGRTQKVHHARISDVVTAVNTVQPGLAAHVSGGDTAMIWLNDHSATGSVVKALAAKATALHIQDIYSGERLALTLNRPERDPRVPDIILQPQPSVAWSSAGTKAINGGLSDRATHVALLISGSQLTGRTDPTLVPTTQLSPLLLRALGMEKFDLQALHMEHSPALPGIF